MSLVPYLPHENRQIVLRHGSSVVVYDSQSKQLSLRDDSQAAVDFTTCPYCQQPLGGRSSPENDRRSSTSSPHDRSEASSSFVNPDYWRMLAHSAPTSRTPSPRRRLAQAEGIEHESFISQAQQPLDPPTGAEFVGSAPLPDAAREGRGGRGGISSSAFIPNYFKTFFVEEGELGRGGKGVVLLVRHVLDGVPLGQFACKRVPVGDDHEWLEKVLVEVQLLQNLSHQNLVSYRHVWLEDYQITKFGPSVPCAFILQQYCNAGDLLNYVLGPSAKDESTAELLKQKMRRRSKGKPDAPEDLKDTLSKMQFNEIFSFFKDITSGLNFLHMSGYIHRDLKPSNCLLHRSSPSGKPRILVSDFGEVQTSTATRNSTGATGTISYCAPEVLRKDPSNASALGNFTTKSDIFSLGMIVYFMCFGRLPYAASDALHDENEDPDALRVEITTWAGLRDERRARPDLPDHLYIFLQRLLSLRPDHRPTTEEILANIRGGYASPDETSPSRGNHFEDLGPRVSPLDSPSPTPKRIPKKHAKPGPSRLRHDETLDDTPAPSPVSTEADTDAENDSPAAKYNKAHPGLESSIVLSTRRVHADISPSPTPRTPRFLLPPPQMGLIGRLRLALGLPYGAEVQAASALGLGVRMALFILKLRSLGSPCLPFAARADIAVPLICLGVLDFLSPHLLGDDDGRVYGNRSLSRVEGVRATMRSKWTVSIGLTVLHTFLWILAKRFNVLCVAASASTDAGVGSMTRDDDGWRIDEL